MKEAAKELFFGTDLSQKQIAQQVGVSEKTMYLWIKKGGWKALKAGMLQMPALIVEDLYSQIVEINQNVRQRAAGQRYATPVEMETMRKASVIIGNIKKQASYGEAVQVLMGFIAHMGAGNQELTVQLTNGAEQFLNGKRVRHFQPYEMEYDAESPYEKTAPGNEPEMTGNEPELTSNVMEQPEMDLQPEMQAATIPPNTAQTLKDKGDTLHRKNLELEEKIRAQVREAEKTGNVPDTQSRRRHPNEIWFKPGKHWRLRDGKAVYVGSSLDVNETNIFDEWPEIPMPV